MSAEHTASTQFDPERLGNSGAVVARCREAGRPALVGYLPVGYPDLDTSLRAMRSLLGDDDNPGADLVEIGLPYSDPVMDGPIIQRAATSALARGVRTRDVFTAAESVADAGGLGLVMTYWNLVEQYGVDAFARDLAAAGGAGLITPDLTPDEAEPWFEASDKYHLDRVFLVSPSTTDERLRSTVAACRGWVYATAVMGVTGLRTQTTTAGPELVRRVREVNDGLPIGMGVGISNGRQVKDVGEFADAVIVGSALVKTLVDAEDAKTPGGLGGLSDVVAELVSGVSHQQ